MGLHAIRTLLLLEDLVAARARAAGREMPARENVLARLQDAVKRQAKAERELAWAARWFESARNALTAAEQASAETVTALAYQIIADNADTLPAVLPGDQPAAESEPGARDAATQPESQAGDAG
jgi:hypothetical protein